MNKGSLDILYLFQLILGLYLIVCAVTGRGKAYENEKVPEENRERYRRAIRLFCIFTGPLATINAAFSYLSWTIAANVTFALTALALIVGIVAIVRVSKPKR